MHISNLFYNVYFFYIILISG